MRKQIPDIEIINDLRTLANNLGKKSPISKYSVSSYENTFGTWRKALEAFIDYMNEEQSDSENISNDNEPVQLTDNILPKNQKKKEFKVKKTPKQINL